MSRREVCYALCLNCVTISHPCLRQAGAGVKTELPMPDTNSLLRGVDFSIHIPLWVTEVLSNSIQGITTLEWAGERCIS
jgi:hypothetical protein